MRWLDKILKKPARLTRRLSLLPDGVCAYAIGDVHGRADLLERLLELVKLDVAKGGFSQGYIVFLGDYIDRGFQSKKVLDLILDQNWGDIKTVFLLGNHEQTMLDFLRSPDVGMQWAEYGGLETLNSYTVQAPQQKQDIVAWEQTMLELQQALPSSHLDFLQNLRSSFELGNCFFVHAGIDPAKSLDMQTDDDLLWIRDKFLASKKTFEKVIVHGHTPEDAPVWNGRRIGADTGAYITNRLTAARICGNQVDFLST